MMFSTWKTYVGPAFSYACGFSYWEMVLYNLGAALISIFLFLRYSRAINKTFTKIFRKKNKRRFNPRYRKHIRFWNKYGLYGTLFLTPILIGLPIGVFLAVRFGTKKQTIFYITAIMVVFWSSLFYYLGILGYAFIDLSLIEKFDLNSS